mmetsp:Transcript_7171/g.17478  ORF Transcript_7171/g.17478 Transcript_7171/m.17478 type:complete len:111 (-) Transcript_7171:253-585(-)
MAKVVCLYFTTFSIIGSKEDLVAVAVAVVAGDSWVVAEGVERELPVPPERSYHTHVLMRVVAAVVGSQVVVVVVAAAGVAGAEYGEDTGSVGELERLRQSVSESAPPPCE